MESEKQVNSGYYNKSDYIWITVASIFLIVLIIIGLTRESVQEPYNQGINIIPKPNSIIMGEGVFEINRKTVFVVAESLQTVKTIVNLKNKIKTATGLNLKTVTVKPKSNFIEIFLDHADTNGTEGYTLVVKPNFVKVSSSALAGIHNGLQSLLHLLPAEIECLRKKATVDWLIPSVTINDSPRFRWRGMHLDVCRHFLPVEEIKKHIDMISRYKLNTLHLHLTDDQAWRIEIKKYPLLTQIGSKRIEGEGFEHSGYYTQEQIKDIVQYAADRFVNIVPEIEMPGHALAALSGYPNLSCTGGPFTPRIIWGVEEDVFCAGKEETFQFLEDVINEVVTLFPYEYFHIGGDECPKDRWKECELCQERIKNENLKDEHELQSYFVKRIEKVLLSHNKKMVGWDEILEGGLASSATVMSWRGEQGGIEAANMGHDVVMTPGSHCYLDHYQGSPKVEPVAIGGMTTLEKVYSYEPIPDKINPENTHHILGAQGNNWSEYLYKPERVDYIVYPRIFALAEVNWTTPELKDFNYFLMRLDNHHVRMDLKKINYHIPLPEGPANVEAFVDSIIIAFTTSRDIDIVYTTDESEPHHKSERYERPLVFKESAILKVATVLKTGKTSPVRTINIIKQEYAPSVKSEEITNGIKVSLTNGIFRKVSDIDKVKEWADTTIENMNRFHRLFNIKKPSAAIATGFIKIPENGVYRFSTNADHFYINDNLLINNEGEVKKYSRNDATIALEAGLHRVKFIVINGITGGWPQAWNGRWLDISTDGKNFTAAEFY